MLQLVDDTQYIGRDLKRYQWPSRWVSPTNESRGQWQQNEAGSEFAVDAGDRESWLPDRHLVPHLEDWTSMDNGDKADVSKYRGMLITDYYAYNDAYTLYPLGSYGSTEATNWVGDLALECDVEVTSPQGELLLDLVEGGIHYKCQIDVASGKAQLSTDSSRVAFRDDQGRGAEKPTGSTV